MLLASISNEGTADAMEPIIYDELRAAGRKGDADEFTDVYEMHLDEGDR